MDDNTFLDKLAGILQIARVSLNQPDFQLNPNVWDSFAVLETMALIDEYYGITISAVELAKCDTTDALLSMVQKHKTS